MKRTQLIRFAVGLALLGLAMAAVALLPPSENPTLLTEAFFDAGHVPMFMLFALLALRLARTTLPGPPGRHYLLAGTLVVLVGLGTESLQKFGARDAGWTDFLRDLLGGGAALLLAMAVENRRPFVKIAGVLGAFALLGAGLAELVSVQLDYRGRDAAFPVLAGFDAAWESRFVHGHDADLVIMPAPRGWSGVSGTPSGRLDVRVADYPSLSIREPFPDWRGHDALQFEVWSELAEPVDVTVRIHDRIHNNGYSDRYNGAFRIEPGSNRILIPLEQVRQAPRGRELDLANVAGISVFLDHPTRPVRLWFGEIELIANGGTTRHSEE